MTLRRREGDPDFSERWRDRADPMELRLGVNGKSIQAKGLTVVVLIVMLAALGAVWVLDHFQTEAMTSQHKGIKLSQDRTSCIVAMTPSQRERFLERYQPGAFKQTCPWVDE